MYLEPFARRFAAAGIAVLVFDYRSFGASGGERADTAAQAATEWFTEHLVNAKAVDA
jgi:uncharacterized protein